MNLKKVLILTLAACAIVGSTGINSITTYASDAKKEPVKIETIQTRGFEKVLIETTVGADIKSCPNLRCTTVGRGEYGEYLDYLHEYTYDSNGDQWFKVRANNGNIGWIQEYKCVLL
ncbi:SH3 domain-containing protein [Clostridium sp. UBA4548]|uniref:SH3 domain-containing protein n=1 Tax=Clostridium sp. UBA4548 TaxID=1946361 RepID=UPI0025B9F66A|nr:SH3 domain-containing protein [Clostridium sp. UBA4548]